MFAFIESFVIFGVNKIYDGRFPLDFDNLLNCIGGVMIKVLVSGAIARGFESR